MTESKREPTIFERTPDVEAEFEFNGTRTKVICDRYVPVHKINDTYLTSGLHRYFNKETVAPDGTAEGTITFLTPEAYPHCLWPGKRITIQEGSVIVGYATITKVLNPLLKTDHSEQ